MVLIVHSFVVLRPAWCGFFLIKNINRTQVRVTIDVWCSTLRSLIITSQIPYMYITLQENVAFAGPPNKEGIQIIYGQIISIFYKL